VSTTNLAAVIKKCPKAYAAGRVYGSGTYALLSCDDGIARRVHLYETAMARNRALWKLDAGRTCGMPECTGDHVSLDFESYTTTPQPLVMAQGQPAPNL
jgi:hypothetical protein